MIEKDFIHIKLKEISKTKRSIEIKSLWNFTNRLIYFIFWIFHRINFFILFFLMKNTSFNYLPSSRVKNNLLSKKINFGEFSKDSALIKNIIRNGEINFSKSKIGSDSCNIYLIANQNKKIFANSEL